MEDGHRGDGTRRRSESRHWPGEGRGDRGIAACRQSSVGLDELGVRVETGVDVSDDAAIASLVRSLDGTRIDILVNNAGIERRSGEGLVAHTWEAVDRVHAADSRTSVSHHCEMQEPQRKIVLYP